MGLPVALLLVTALFWLGTGLTMGTFSVLAFGMVLVDTTQRNLSLQGFDILEHFGGLACYLTEAGVMLAGAAVLLAGASNLYRFQSRPMAQTAGGVALVLGWLNLPLGFLSFCCMAPLLLGGALLGTIAGASAIAVLTDPVVAALFDAELET